jgi:hypothetical protein
MSKATVRTADEDILWSLADKVHNDHFTGEVPKWRCQT